MVESEVATTSAQAELETASPYNLWRRSAPRWGKDFFYFLYVKMLPGQVEQLLQQFVHKNVLERYNLPRLSLFYIYLDLQLLRPSAPGQ